MKITDNSREISTRIARLAALFPKALDKGLGLWVRRASRLSTDYLSGYGGNGIWARHNIGGYPVPVRTGHLRRSDNYVNPNSSKQGITTRHGQVALINSARYAHALHEGTHTHTGYGPRQFHLDAIRNSRTAGLNDILISLREARARAAA